MTDESTRETLAGMLGYVRLWRGDMLAGILPTSGSLAQAELELIAAMDDGEEDGGMSDQEEYEAAHACGRMADARALREGRF